jgi:hypothetical protein
VEGSKDGVIMEDRVLWKTVVKKVMVSVGVMI